MCDLSLVPSKFETDELLTVVVFWWSSERRLMLKMMFEADLLIIYPCQCSQHNKSTEIGTFYGVILNYEVDCLLYQDVSATNKH